MNRLRRVVIVAGAVAISVLVWASAAAADPAKPSDDRSEVQSIEPPTDAVSVEVVGGDGFLHLHVGRGHDVVVEGYEGEPWLHIAVDSVETTTRRMPRRMPDSARSNPTTRRAPTSARYSAQYPSPQP